MSERTYVPKSYAKEMQGQYGPYITVSFNVDELVKFATQHVNEKGYVKLLISPRKEADQFGNTHSVMLDTWKPKEGGGGPRRTQAPPPPQRQKQSDQPTLPHTDGSDDDVPF